ncbi:cation-translocating P-type ATPase [Dictyobacter formicarum]|uniref:Cation-transporting P-type ATPase N-terminal domain-containing protein n=1 Tax=Dictyobacter formicarum TaxID=2778368 RepID=A0ABQ3VJE8_9CHLR|nr:HAD-IC family P-type ATPase [Dictyobacter formicarum]GHO85804.1 hypothetical protein KSZ_38100 [Dictyobacter formicarum]
MSVAGTVDVLHTITGRVRVHVPGWSGQGKRSIEMQLQQVPGVERSQANPVTGNILVIFDSTVLNEQAILHTIQALDLEQINKHPVEPEPPPVAHEKEGKTVRARIAVRGLDRDPAIARRVIERLEKYPGVRVRANPLTCRVLVEFTEHEQQLEDLIAEVADLELPDLVGEDRPAYPLDPSPLIQSVTRMLGSALGLGFLTARRLMGLEEALPGARTAAYAAGVIGLIQGFPPVRTGLRHMLGRSIADLLLSIPNIILLTLSSSPLGLALAGAESLRLFTEVQERRAAWRAHEKRMEQAPSAQPNALIRMESDERVPLMAYVHEGTGTALGLDGMPQPVYPGATVPPGAHLYGGPFVLQLSGETSFERFIPQERPAPPSPTLYDQYQRFQGPISLIYAGLTGLLTRSFGKAFTALLLVNPRTAPIGMESADLHANAYVLRAGVTIVGTRPSRSIRLPQLLLLDNARLLTERLELTNALPLTEEMDAAEALTRAAGIAAAAGLPWGPIFRTASITSATRGSFDGKVARAFVDEIQYTLGPVENWQALPEAASLRQRGNYVLALWREHEERPLAIFVLRPCLAPEVPILVAACQRVGVELALLSQGDELVLRGLAHRAHIALIESNSALKVIAERQKKGDLVAFASDNMAAMAGFAACDLAIGLSDERSRFLARADLLAPDLAAVAAIIEAGARREATVRDSIGLATISTIAGVIWGLRSMPEVRIASRIVYITALAAIADGWLRLRGGKRTQATITRLVDPQPERWGRQGVDDVLEALHTSRQGLTKKQASERRRAVPTLKQKNALGAAVLEQLHSPLTGILATGAALSFLFGSIGDVVLIGTTIVVNTMIGVWQEHKANQVAEALRQIGVSQARVLRDNQEKTIPANEIVPGDILLLASGDRIAADARIIDALNLEVDEAALTGESFPVRKMAVGGNDTERIVLDGSNVLTGTGHAVVVAVGGKTRMGATRLALMEENKQLNPLGTRLSRMLRIFLPVSAAGGALVIASGLLWKQPFASILAIGASVAMAGIPEGLPLLARVGETGVAHRLANHRAVVRRLSSVEALGRVNVVCTDKTGTMTKGRLQLNVVADANQEAPLSQSMPESLSHVLLTAALASPHPDTQGAQAHPTDVAVVQGAIEAGLGEQVSLKHEVELSFDPVRSFSVTVVQDKLCIKGAPEAILSRCSSLLQDGVQKPLDEVGRDILSNRSLQLAEKGLRVLMVAEGAKGGPLDDPQDLTALGFVGISDPLRPTVVEAVRHCQEAGIRVIMITGDHPVTARAIAQEAGLLQDHEEVLNATTIADLQNGDLDRLIAKAAVIARATPLDKLRIIESLHRQGHTVAMTGDGVNDAPALRLADIGIAMGKSGTEVARQTADVVITDDDFSTLVQGCVEGRSFWRNMRRSLGLLLGGNLGELGLVVGASLLGANMPLTVAQILAVNAITDILPALAVILQQPEHRNLTRLRREGTAALGAPLRNEIIRRGLATTLPSLGAYLLTRGMASLPQARSVAFASIVTTQLAQTLMAGRSEGHLTRPVLGAVGGSLGVLLAAFAIPSLRRILSLVTLSPSALLLIAASALSSVLLNSLFSRTNLLSSHPRASFKLAYQA